MSDPVVVGFGTQVTSTSSSAVTLSVPQPVDAVDMDLLLVVVRQDYVYTTSGSVRVPSAPAGTIRSTSATAGSTGTSTSQRVSLMVYALLRSGSGDIPVDISAGTSATGVKEAAFCVAVRNASTIRNPIGQTLGGSMITWPTTAQTLTVDAGNSAAMSIITNRSTTAQTLDTANGFSLDYSSATQPATALAYRTVDTPSQAVPQWTGSGGLRAQVTFEIVFAAQGFPYPQVIFS
jgi:hypothetical protein